MVTENISSVVKVIKYIEQVSNIPPRSKSI